MIKKNLFNKRSINLRKYLILSFIIFSLLLFVILLFVNSKQQFFIVPEFVGSFYIIPNNTGGKKVINLDKKSLHLKDEMSANIEIINDPLLKYSIQIFSSNYYYFTNTIFWVSTLFPEINFAKYTPLGLYDASQFILL